MKKAIIGKYSQMVEIIERTEYSDTVEHYSHDRGIERVTRREWRNSDWSEAYVYVRGAFYELSMDQTATISEYRALTTNDLRAMVEKAMNRRAYSDNIGDYAFEEVSHMRALAVLEYGADEMERWTSVAQTMLTNAVEAIAQATQQISATEPEPTEATENAAHLADLAEQAAHDVETAATICDADAYDNRAQMYAAAAADEATRYDADDATERHAARAARAAEQARAALTARVNAGLTEADTAVALNSDYARTLTLEAIEKAGADPAAIVNEAMNEANDAEHLATAAAIEYDAETAASSAARARRAAIRAANAAARALLAEYAETTGRTIEQDDDEYIAAHRVARDDVTGVSARATGYDREIVADMVERIAQAVRDDIPTGPEDYHAELVRKADDAAARFCAAYTDTTGIVPFFEDAAAVCRVARADVAHEYGVTAADRETVSAMTEELADTARHILTAEPRPTYQRAELLAYLGEPDDYDVTAIEHDATAYDAATGRTVWAVDAETLAAIAERHQLQFYAPAF